MPTGDEYRAKAAELLALAQTEANPSTVFEYQTLARSYLRLAEMADSRKPIDIVYETPVHDPPAGEPIVVKSAEPPVSIPKPESDPDSEIA